MSEHRLNLHREVEDVPDPELTAQWRERRLTGKARAICACGLDTGIVPSSEATAAFQRHAEEIKTPA